MKKAIGSARAQHPRTRTMGTPEGAAAAVSPVGACKAVENVALADAVGAQRRADLGDDRALVAVPQLELLAGGREAHPSTHGACQRPRPCTSAWAAACGPHEPGVY